MMTKDEQQEVEANRFAMALLMPRNKVIELAKNYLIDLADPDCLGIRQLAAKFKVPKEVMALRLYQLGVIAYE